MKKIIFMLLVALIATVPSCKPDIEVPPLNIIKDADVFGSTAGIDAYMARIYSEMPIEDFRWNVAYGFRNGGWFGSASALAGEAISRDQVGTTESFNYWTDAYTLIRNCNYFSETIPAYANLYTPVQVNHWLGEVRFIRAYTYFALAKRYGGVPIIDKVLTRPGQSIDDVTAAIEEYKVPRASEQAVWDFIAADLDYAYANMAANSSLLATFNTRGRTSKYAAAALKSRAMLYAGSIAKYNTITLTGGGVQVCGIPASKANDYFKAAYDAADLLNSTPVGYTLYKRQWSATDKAAQAANYAAMFLDATDNNKEAIFVKAYKFPDAVHAWDANQIPRQLWAGGYSAETNPTLDLVEMYDFLPKNPDGSFQTTDPITGKYIEYNSVTDPFANVEGRAKGTIIFPWDVFKGQAIELRRGVYTGPTAGGISRLLPVGSTNSYPTTNIVQSVGPEANQTTVTLPGGGTMPAAGASGFFTGINSYAGGISGFSVKKYLDPSRPQGDMVPGRSDQAWIDLRYAEVLLNRAEAAYELFTAGQGATYQTQALADINAIRDRAGAISATLASLNLNEIRKERRKELAFENKTWWDLKRWRTAATEMNGRRWRILNAFYILQSGKYFFDDRFDERGSIYTFDPRWYYQQIPAAAIAKSPNLVQNPN